MEAGGCVKGFPFCPFLVSSAHFGTFLTCFYFAFCYSQQTLSSRQLSEFPPCIQPCLQTPLPPGQASNRPGLLTPQTCLHLICFNSLPPPRTKVFLYKSACLLCKSEWYKRWRELQQKVSNATGLAGAQSSECTRVSTDTWDAAVTVGITKCKQGRG